VLIAWQGWRLARTALDILLESTPDGLDPQAVTTAIEAIDGVDAVHDFHVWSLSSEMRALSAHVVVSGHPTLEEAQLVGARVKEVLAHEFAIAHSTLELECEPCADDPHCDADAIPTTAVGHAHSH
jgi:cobalt-zinc-cadmium efflux system protein